MKGHKRLISILLVLGMVAALLPVAAMAADVKIGNIATQAQALRADGYIATMDYGECLGLKWGDVFYYPLRQGTGSTTINGAGDLTPANYTLTYTPGKGESFNAVQSLEMVYAPTGATASRWWLKVTLIDKPADAPAEHHLNGTFNVSATTPVINVSMTPKTGNYWLAVSETGGIKWVADNFSTVPQYIKSASDTYISNDTSGASAAKELDYGTVIYYLLRTGVGPTGSTKANIRAPHYMVPEDYALAISDAQGIKSGGLSVVSQRCVSGETFWYLKVEFIEQGSLTTDTPVQGLITITPSDKPAFQLNIGTSNNITLKASTAAPVDKTIYSLATQAQAKGGDGVIRTLNATECQNLNYGGVIYYALRETDELSSYLVNKSDLTPENYTCGYTKSADEPFNVVQSATLVYDKNTETTSRWWMKLTLIDEPAGAPAKLDLKGVFTLTATSPATNLTMTPSSSYKLAVVSAAVSPEKIVTATSTAPQYIKEGDTLIAQNGTGTTSSRFPYGQTVYFILRDAAGDIITPNYIVPGDYTVGNTSTQVASTELVKGNYSGGERWYVKLVFIDRPDGAGETAVTGTLTLTHKGSGTVATLDLTARGIKLGEATASEKIVAATSTAPQYIKEGDTLIAQNGTSSTSSRFPYGQTVYFILRDKDGKDIIDPDYIVPGHYTVSNASAQVASTELVKGRYSGGERWYVKLVFIDRPDGAGDTTVEGGLVILHKSSGAVTPLSLSLRNIILSDDTTLRPFDRIATWAQRMVDGEVRSISGASTSSPTVSYGEMIYYALANGSNTSLTSYALFDPDDYKLTYQARPDNVFFPIEKFALVYEKYATSSASGHKWFLMLQLTDDAQGLQLADGTILIQRKSDGIVVASLDLGENVPLIFGGEDDTVNDKGVLTVGLVHHIGSTKMVENEAGYVGRATTDLGISSNVAYGETAYYMLYGQDKFGGQHGVSDVRAVEDIKIKNKLEQNADKVAKIEIVKKRCAVTGYYGWYYFLAITFVEKPTTTSRYGIVGDIVLEGKGKYGINTPDNTCKIFIDTVVGPEYAHGRVDTRDEQALRTLSDTHRRFSFKNDALGSDEEDTLYFYGMSDDNYFVVDTRGQDDILLGNTVEYHEAVGARFPGADLFFFNGSAKQFNHHGVMTFSFSPDTFIYERNGLELSRINGLKYDEDEKAFRFLTKKIGSYVFSDTELDYERYNIDHIGIWAQTPNEDGSLSSISGASTKGPTLEYGATVYYALRNAEDKGIVNQMALEPEHFTFGLVTNDPNAPAVKTAGLTYRTNWIKSSDSRSDKWYVAITFAEVPDPGVARKVSGDFVVYYKGEEVTRLTLGSTDAGDFTLTLHGGRPVESDWIPHNYVVPVLREEDEIGQAVVTSYLDAESESDGEQTAAANDADSAEAAEQDGNPVITTVEGSEPDGE